MTNIGNDLTSARFGDVFPMFNKSLGRLPKRTDTGPPLENKAWNRSCTYLCVQGRVSESAVNATCYPSSYNHVDIVNRSGRRQMYVPNTSTEGGSGRGF